MFYFLHLLVLAVFGLLLWRYLQMQQTVISSIELSTELVTATYANSVTGQMLLLMQGTERTQRDFLFYSSSCW